MSSVSNTQAVDVFKRVYGKMTDLVPQDQALSKLIPFSEKQKVGDRYIESVILSNETGWSLLGTGADALEINPAIAGTVKQTEVFPYISVLPSVIPWAMISRSAGAGDKAFVEVTKHVVKNNLRSHEKLLEIMRLYGQSTKLLGYVSYATATYRGVSFTNGGGALNGITFTAGINAASKAILLKPGDFASGIWVGMESCIVNQVDSTGAVVASGKLVSVESEYGYITVDFTPVAASSTTSHRLCFQGMETGREAIGIHKILSTNGTLFGINNSTYSLFRGTQVSLANVKMTLERMQNGVAQAVNRAGLEGDVQLLVNPRSWANLCTTEAGARHYDSSYKPSSAENGFEDLVYHAQTGKIIVKAHRMVMEGDAFGLHLEGGDWSRSGSAEVGFNVPGMSDKELVFVAENQTAMVFRSYSDQYLFCNTPGKSIYFSGINDESAS